MLREVNEGRLTRTFVGDRHEDGTGANGGEKTPSDGIDVTSHSPPGTRSRAGSDGEGKHKNGESECEKRKRKEKQRARKTCVQGVGWAKAPSPPLSTVSKGQKEGEIGGRTEGGEERGGGSGPLVMKAKYYIKGPVPRAIPALESPLDWMMDFDIDEDEILKSQSTKQCIEDNDALGDPRTLPGAVATDREIGNEEGRQDAGLVTADFRAPSPRPGELFAVRGDSSVEARLGHTEVGDPFQFESLIP